MQAPYFLKIRILLIKLYTSSHDARKDVSN